MEMNANPGKLELRAAAVSRREHRNKWNACPLQVWRVLKRCWVMDIKILGCILGAIGDREGLCTNELPCGGERNMHSGVGLNSGRVGVLGWELWKASGFIFDSWFPLVNQPPFWSISWGQLVDFQMGWSRTGSSEDFPTQQRHMGWWQWFGSQSWDRVSKKPDRKRLENPQTSSWERGK